LHDTTFVSPFTLLLFGGNLTLEHDPHMGQGGDTRVVMRLDKWLAFNMTEATAVLVKYLRNEINR